MDSIMTANNYRTWAQVAEALVNRIKAYSASKGFENPLDHARFKMASIERIRVHGTTTLFYNMKDTDWAEFEKACSDIGWVLVRLGSGWVYISTFVKLKCSLALSVNVDTGEEEN